MAVWHISPRRKKGYLAQAFAQHNLEAYWRWQMIQMTQRYKNTNDNAMAQFARTSFPLADKTSAKTNIFCVPLLLRQKETKKLVQRRCCLAKKQHRDSDEYSEIILNFRSYYYIEFIKIFFLRYAKIEYKIILLLKSRLIFWDKVLQAVAREICFLYENNLDLSLARNIFM